MERVLDIYKRVLNPEYPVVCMDESPKQLISETKVPILALPGRPAIYDCQYRRCGVCNIFLACEPLAGKRMVKITERRKKPIASPKKVSESLYVASTKKVSETNRRVIGIYR